MNAFSYARPRALAEALRLLRNGAVALAGGTDLVGLMKDGLARPQSLVDLTGIEGLRGWSHAKGRGLRIGALKGGNRCFAVDGENRYHAILGANECHIVSPSDLVPALLAYDAEIGLTSSRGTRRMKLADLFVTPHGKERREHSLRAGELITEVRVPEAALARRGTYLKAMDRKAWSFALVSVAAAARIERGVAREVRLIMGGVAPVPWRVVAAEKGLEGSALDDASCADAADRMLAGATPLRDNGYKVTLARELVRRALRSLVA